MTVDLGETLVVVSLGVPFLAGMSAVVRLARAFERLEVTVNHLHEQVEFLTQKVEGLVSRELAKGG